MKKLLPALLLGLVALSSQSSYSASATANFDVKINLVSACKLDTPTDVEFTYSSFQVGAATATGGAVKLKCTNTLPFSLQLDQNTVTDSAVALQYTLGLRAASDTGNGTPTLSSAGNGSEQNFVITGTMAGGQAGSCAQATCNNSTSSNKQRVLTVNF
jgi:spore coat protein U-like protein